jgi:alpha-ketoglutarate-dependent taurine dioxygenase
VQTETLKSGATTMTVFHVATEPGSGGATAALADIRSEIDHAVSTNGAVLLRGPGISTAEDFHRVVNVFGVPLGTYRGGNTPRSAVTTGIYTSTEYPAQYDISLHNEMSYANRWPERLYFCCLKAADSGGATPVTDGRALLADLDADVRHEFETRGVMYRQNLHGGFGLGKSWQQTFETGDRAVVEEFLRDAQAEFTWTADDALRVSQTRPAVRTHPVTGERVWFNQADQWHPSNLPPAEAEALLSIVDRDEDLPHSVAYGDGGAIPVEHLDHVRQTARRNELAVPWQPGDIMMIDNMLVLHGRQAFAGSRRVVVSMT